MTCSHPHPAIGKCYTPVNAILGLDLYRQVRSFPHLLSDCTLSGDGSRAMSSVQPTLSRSSDEEDISHAGGWIEESESPSEVSRSGSKHDKGKRKESDEETLQDHTQETEDGGPEDSGELYTGVDEYPPTTEEVEESRRVEEVRVSLALLPNWLTQITSRTSGNGRLQSANGGRQLASPMHQGAHLSSLVSPAAQASCGPAVTQNGLHQAESARTASCARRTPTQSL